MNAPLPTRCRSACRPFTVVIGDEFRAGPPSGGTSGLRIFACGETVDYATENAPEVARAGPDRFRGQELTARLAADIDPGLNDFTQGAGLAHHTMQVGRQVVMIDKDRINDRRQDTEQAPTGRYVGGIVDHGGAGLFGNRCDPPDLRQ